MPTNAKTKVKRAAQRKSGSAPGSAIALLKKDHREVEGFFEQYEETKDNRAKRPAIGWSVPRPGRWARLG